MSYVRTPEQHAAISKRMIESHKTTEAKLTGQALAVDARRARGIRDYPEDVWLPATTQLEQTSRYVDGLAAVLRKYIEESRRQSAVIAELHKRLELLESKRGLRVA